MLEQIERETGQKMPPTFTVASRPQSAPWKRHYYFKQTAYSVKTFRTETNVKDLSVLKDEKHPTRYDLKGVGGGGLVVGAGSVRADGEVYAGSLASLGTRRSSIERMLAEQSEDFCDSGKTFADSASGKAKFHQLAFNPRLRIGNASFFRRLKPTIVGDIILLPPHIPTQKEQRLSLMVETLHGFPQTLPQRRLHPAGDGAGRHGICAQPQAFAASHEGSRSTESGRFRGRTGRRENHVDSKRGSERGSGMPVNHTPHSLSLTPYTDKRGGAGGRRRRTTSRRDVFRSRQSDLVIISRAALGVLTKGESWNQLSTRMMRHRRQCKQKSPQTPSRSLRVSDGAGQPMSLPDRIERIGRALTADELASMMSVSRITIFKQAKAGRIPSFRIGTCVRFDPKTVAQWLREM